MISSTAPPDRTLLVGFGKLGARLAPRLLGAGGGVIALRRGDGELPPGVLEVRADLSHPLTEPLPAVDAMVVTLPPSGTGGYRAALTHLAHALPVMPARTVFVSSTGVFGGWPSTLPVTEQDVPSPSSERSRELLDGEDAARELFDAVVVRPAGIYGPGRESLLRQVRQHATVNHRRRTNRIHEVDLVRALEVLLTLSEPPRVLHAVDAAPATLGEVVAFIAEEMGVDAPADDPSAQPSGTVLDGALLRSMLGELRYPTFREGYAEMVDPRQ